MKHLKYLAVLFFLSSPAFAAVGTDNLVVTLNLGGNMSALMTGGLNYGQTGFAVGFDFGYQYYSSGTSAIHGHDLVVGLHYGTDRIYVVSDGINQVEIPSSIEAYSRPLFGYLSSTYSLGFYAAKTRFMFDIIGLSIMYGERQIKDSSVNIVEKPYMGLGFNLPIGFRAVFDMGFIVGFRHSLSFFFPIRPADLGPLQVEYNIHVVLGFAFGKKR